MDEFVSFPRTGLPRQEGVATQLDLEQADLLDRSSHPFWRDDGETPGAESCFFMARRGARPVGRIAALINHSHNRFESEKEGHPVRSGNFGFYAAIDDQAVANALLDAAAEWLRSRGMDEMLGPASPSHNYYYGSRVRAEEQAPHSPSRIMEADNPEYYNQQYECWGLEPVRRLFGFDCDLESEKVLRTTSRFERTIAETIAGTGMRLRRLNLDDFDAEITRANELINLSLAENWGFSPMTHAELAYMGKQMRLLIDPNLVLFVELDGEPVGISLSLPDYAQVLGTIDGRLSQVWRVFQFGNMPFVRWWWPHGHAWGTSQIETARVIALGVVPTLWRGSGAVRRELLRLGPALIYETFANVRRAGYRWLTASWVHEHNRSMLAPFQLAGIEPTRVWKVYRRDLG